MPNKSAIASRIVARAHEVKHAVTRTLLTPAIPGQIEGLENCVKTQKSVLGKLNRSRSGRLYVNDSLRFTFVFDKGTYHSGMYRLIRTLKNEFHMKEVRRRNDWGNNTGYKGINSTFIQKDLWDETGRSLLLVEIQFHTHESYRVTKSVHAGYEVSRELDDNDAEKARLDEIARMAYSEIEVVSLGGGTGEDIEAFEWGDTRVRAMSRLTPEVAGRIEERLLPRSPRPNRTLPPGPL